MRRYHLALPFLFAAHPVLSLYAHNFGRADPAEVLPSLAMSFGFALLVLLVARLACRDMAKALVIASVFLVIFFAYNHAADVLFKHRMGDPTAVEDFVLAPLIGLLAVGLGVALAEGSDDLRPTLNILGVAAVALVATTLLQVLPRELGRVRPALPRIPEAELRFDPGAPAMRATPPDIYYIILDRYPGEEASESELDFDNHEFLGWLRGKGFYVASKSRCNYPRTFLSLGSSLNMVYLTSLAKEMGRDSTDETPVRRMLRDSTVVRLLKARGYRYVHTGSWWEPTRTNPHADVDLGSPFVPLSQFSRLFLDTTLIRPFLAGARLVPDRKTKHRETTLYQLARLQGVPTTPSPKFVFAHLLLPHPPWVFKKNGDPLAAGEASGDPARHCRDQIVYTNRRMRELVENILAHSEQPPIIVLQADEGMQIATGGGGDAPGGRRGELGRERYHFPILNAYYLPGLDQAELYPTISPVNSFRVIFNHYFGTHLPRLPDELWQIRGRDRPYDQEQVKVEGVAQHGD